MKSTLTSKGQITLPKPVREFLKLRIGDRLEFVIQGTREVLLKPAVMDVQSLKGFLARKNQKPISIEKMNEAIRRRFK